MIRYGFLNEMEADEILEPSEVPDPKRCSKTDCICPRQDCVRG